jgi:ABC-2 type transport system ATP-binding protein
MVRVRELSLSYGPRKALDSLSLEIGEGELFALLGPNGSGKSTLLRILATLLLPGGGLAEVAGLNVVTQSAAARRRLGVVFQFPSLDVKLTVSENLRFQGYLYGLSGKSLATRSEELLTRFGLADRRSERVETLSGGLKRRVELAKTLLHRPGLLLLDEPSTGLDLAARQSFWNILTELMAEGGLTVVLATHLMDEADRCGMVALLDEGKLVDMDTPTRLKHSLGDTVITIEAPHPESLAAPVAERCGVQPTIENGKLRLTRSPDPSLAHRLLEWFPGKITSVQLGPPTLGDVFLARTGRPIGNTEPQPESGEPPGIPRVDDVNSGKETGR